MKPTGSAPRCRIDGPSCLVKLARCDRGGRGCIALDLLGLSDHREAHVSTSRDRERSPRADYRAALLITLLAAGLGLVGLWRHEIWRDEAIFQAHTTMPHLAEWRALGAGLGVSDRKLIAYEIASERAL